MSSSWSADGSKRRVFEEVAHGVSLKGRQDSKATL